MLHILFLLWCYTSIARFWNLHRNTCIWQCAAFQDLKCTKAHYFLSPDVLNLKWKKVVEKNVHQFWFFHIWINVCILWLSKLGTTVISKKVYVARVSVNWVLGNQKSTILWNCNNSTTLVFQLYYYFYGWKRKTLVT